MRFRLDLSRVWPPALASALAILGAAATLGGFGRVFFTESPGLWPAAQGGALFGLGIVCYGWTAWLIGRWRGRP